MGHVHSGCNTSCDSACEGSFVDEERSMSAHPDVSKSFLNPAVNTHRVDMQQKQHADHLKAQERVPTLLDKYVQPEAQFFFYY